MKVVCIVQQRLHSTRFPRKALADLCGHSMTWHILQRCKRAKLVDQVVLAVPDEPDWRVLQQIAEECGVMCAFFPSIPADDLVGRYLACATASGADLIVRVPGDNPCVEPRYVDEAVRMYRVYPLAFYSNTTVGWNGRWIDGLGAEVASLSRWHWLDAQTQPPCPAAYREHPHQIFYELAARHPEWFGFPVSTPADLRLDINTLEDYAFIKDLYEHVYPMHPHFTIEDVLAYLRQRRRMLERPDYSGKQEICPRCGQDTLSRFGHAFQPTWYDVRCLRCTYAWTEEEVSHAKSVH